MSTSSLVAMTSTGAATARVTKTRAMRNLSCISESAWSTEHWGLSD